VSAPRRIVLVGFMGSGKTTVGQELSRLLGWPLRDLDQWLEEENGLTIAALFRQRGEAWFRDEERRIARLALALDRQVLAAGGGAFAEAGTREILAREAFTVWLRCELDEILRRVPADGSRPLAGSRETMRRLLDQREPSYRLADLTVDTTHAAPSQVAQRIVAGVSARVSGGPEDDRR
jgi:shikimate kinase